MSRYNKRISGPLQDRIDIFVEVPRVDYEKLSAPSDGESSADIRRLTQAAMQQMQLSVRAYHRILKVPHIIADLGGSDTIGVAHIAEALQYLRIQ